MFKTSTIISDALSHALLTEHSDETVTHNGFIVPDTFTTTTVISQKTGSRIQNSYKML